MYKNVKQTKQYGRKTTVFKLLLLVRWNPEGLHHLWAKSLSFHHIYNRCDVYLHVYSIFFWAEMWLLHNSHDSFWFHFLMRRCLFIIVTSHPEVIRSETWMNDVTHTLTSQLEGVCVCVCDEFLRLWQIACVQASGGVRKGTKRSANHFTWSLGGTFGVWLCYQLIKAENENERDCF